MFNALQDPLGVSVHGGARSRGMLPAPLMRPALRGLCCPALKSWSADPRLGTGSPLWLWKAPPPPSRPRLPALVAPPPTPKPGVSSQALTLSQRELLVRGLPLRLALGQQLLHGLGTLAQVLGKERKRLADPSLECGTAVAEGEAGNTPAPAPHTRAALCQLRSADILRHRL